MKHQYLNFHTCFYGIFRVNDLPVEILNNIFHLVVWSASDGRSGNIARTRIVSICRYWRTVAIQDSTLWNVIWFRNPPEFNQAYLWLERAANAILDIRISIDISHPLSGEATELLINNIFKKISNIRTLIVVVDHWDPVLFVLYTLSEVARRGIPLSLARFEIHHSGASHLQVRRGYEQDPHHVPVPLFGGVNVSSLRYLALNGPGVSVDWNHSASTLANLTSIDFRRMMLSKAPSLECFRSMLEHSPNLFKLILDSAGPQQVPDDCASNLSPIPLPKLKVLVLGNFDMSYGKYLISQFSAPNVVDLSLTTIGDIRNACPPFISHLMSGMSSILTLSLHYMFPGISHQDAPVIKQWLRNMPQLTFLRLIRVHQDFLDLFFSDAQTVSPAITGTGHTQSLLCPKLIYLECHDMPKVEAITNWASRRKAQGIPLSKIYIGQNTFKVFEEETPEALQALVTLMINSTSRNVHVLSIGQRPPEEADLFR